MYLTASYHKHFEGFILKIRHSFSHSLKYKNALFYIFGVFGVGVLKIFLFKDNYRKAKLE